MQNNLAQYRMTAMPPQVSMSNLHTDDKLVGNNYMTTSEIKNLGPL